jgi:hypothetical protein
MNTDKILCPYKYSDYGYGLYARKKLCEKFTQVGSCVFSLKLGEWRIIDPMSIAFYGKFPTPQFAMSALDVILIQYGYTLLSEDEVDKYSLLI